MEDILESRMSLLEQMMKEKRLTTLTHAQYLAQNREYAPGEKLYMREVHFVMAVGLGEGRTMSELAQKLEVTNGAVSQLATRLEKKGYVLRATGGGDKRQIVASLTLKGEALYLQHTEYDKEQFLRIGNCFTSFTDEQLMLCMQYEKVMRMVFEEACKETKMVHR